MVAYKNKKFTQRGESSKPWIKKEQSIKSRGMRFNNNYCKICKRTNHATKDCHSKSNFKNCQPWRRVQAHVVEQEMDEDKDIGDGYHSQIGDKCDDVLQAFVAKSLSATTPN